MTIHELLANNFDLLASAMFSKPTSGRGSKGAQALYGVKKLRDLILQLAVRGKLVVQDSEEEPAEELLRRAAKDRSRMVADGKIRKEKDFPPIATIETPFDLPDGWEWARINDIGHDWGQKIPDSDFTYIDVSAIDNRLGEITAPNVLSALDAPSRARKVVKKGTVIYSTVRPYLKNISVIEDDYAPEPIASTAFAVLHPLQGMPGKFFALYFRSPEFVRYVESVQTGIAYPAINDKQFYGALVPVPPLLEQHRIVAKVDELMELCDQLEQQQNDSNRAHEVLVEVLIGTLTRADSVQEQTEAWNRIGEHFETLFATEYGIDQLKKAILELAVSGKLGTHDSDDEPADVFYRKKLALPSDVQRSNKQMIKGRGVVATEQLPSIPRSWIYRSVDELYQTNHILDYADGNHGSLYPRREDFGTDGVLFLTAAQIDEDGHIAWEACPRLTLEKAKRLTKGWSKEGDVFFTHNATVGRAAVASSCPEKEFLLGTSVTFYRINQGSIDPKYLYLFFSSPTWYSQAAAVMQQTTRDQVSITKQALFFVALPPLPEQRRIVEVVDKTLVILRELGKKLRELQSTQVHLADAIVERAVA